MKHHNGINASLALAPSIMVTAGPVASDEYARVAHASATCDQDLVCLHAGQRRDRPLHQHAQAAIVAIEVAP